MNDTTIETPVATGGKDKGFTLIELLIVIVILGVLATVTVFAVRGITDRGKTNACAADKKTLEVAIEAYIAQNGGAMPTEALLVPNFLRAESATHDIDATGQVILAATPPPSGACTV